MLFEAHWEMLPLTRLTETLPDTDLHSYPQLYPGIRNLGMVKDRREVVCSFHVSLYLFSLRPGLKSFL